MLNVEIVVALYLDSVFWLIVIDARFPNIASNEERMAREIPPKINPRSGETIKVITIAIPVRIMGKFPFKIFLKKGVNWEAPAEIKNIADQRMPSCSALKPNSNPKKLSNISEAITTKKPIERKSMVCFLMS